MTVQREMLDKDELINAQRLRIGELIEQKIELVVENRKLTAIYHAAENLTCPIGAEGEVTFNTFSPLVESLMGAMVAFDDGIRKETITAGSDPDG